MPQVTSVASPPVIVHGRITVFFAIAASAVLMLAGCHYYRVEDPRSGQVFYTDQWVAADGYTGPLTFEDESGRRVSLRQTRVSRIGRQEFLEETAGQDEISTESKQ